MRKIVVTGGAGFAGSHIVDEVCRHFSDAKVVVFDKMTYAGDVRNISHHLFPNRVQLLVGDVADLDMCRRVVKDADLVIHAAAESHVDNSFGNSLEFTRTNVLGTHALMEACRQEKVRKIVHVSTDEVYGQVMEGAASENEVLRPTNPYSSSKAAAEMILQGYLQSYHEPIVIIRANNLYGIRQFPEKIIPRFICHMLTGRKLTLHGNGTNRRHYLSAQDFAEAVVFVAEKGEVGEVYNIGTTEEYTNLQVAELISKAFDKPSREVITYIPDRPFNDGRYSVSWDKLMHMGWKPKNNLSDDINMLVDWYRDNFARYPELFGELPATAAAEVEVAGLLPVQEVSNGLSKGLSS